MAARTGVSAVVAIFLARHPARAQRDPGSAPGHGAPAHPTRRDPGRQGVLLKGDPHRAAPPRHRGGHRRATRSARAPQAPRQLRWTTGAYNPVVYKGLNVVERAFCLLKQWRGLATRYDKHTVNE